MHILKREQISNRFNIFIRFSSGSNREAQQFLSKGAQVIIRMRGLPYDASAKQVVS